MNDGLPDTLSLANRTDLAFYGRFADVIDRGSYLVVRTPHEPTAYLGNQLVVLGDLTPSTLRDWLRVYRREFSTVAGVQHVTLNVQGQLQADCASSSSEPPLHVVENVVLELHRPFPEPTARAAVEPKRLADDSDWRFFMDWRYPEARLASRAYFLRHFGQQRELADAGRAAWFYALVDSIPASSLGILDCDGIARFQAVQTEPRFRRQGIATQLIESALDVADREFDASRAVIVARPDNHEAIGLYSKLGFQPAGEQRFLCSW